MHPTEEMLSTLWKNVAIVVLVVDSTSSASLNDAIDKYGTMLRNPAFLKWRGKSKTGSDGLIPIVVAANKDDLQQRIRKMEIQQVIQSKLQPIVDEIFPDDSKTNSSNESANNGRSNSLMVRKHKFTNMTVINAPNLAVLNAPTRSYDDEEDDSDVEMPNGSTEFTSSPQSLMEKRMNISSERRIDVVLCSAKNGKNVSKVFEKCLKKMVPEKIKQSMSFQTRAARSGSTQQVNAPVWLRQAVDDVKGKGDVDEQRTVFGNPIMRIISMDDDQYTMIDD